MHGRARGTGFAIGDPECRRDLCVLTAEHLVRSGSPQLSGLVNIIPMIPGVYPFPSTITKKTDPELDLAFYRLDNRSRYGKVHEWELAPEGYELKVGDPVRAIAAEHLDSGRRKPYVTDGVVSLIEYDGQRFMFSALVTRGNSGGVIVNDKMQVVGMIVQAWEDDLYVEGYPTSE